MLFDALKSLLGLAGLIKTGKGSGSIPPPTPAQVQQAASSLKLGFTGRAGLGGEELEADDISLFVGGELALFLDSSWLSYAKYYPDKEELEVGILAAKRCQGLVASNMTKEHALSFAHASSKGSWWWSHVFVAGEGAGRGWDRKTHVPVRWL